VIGLLVGRQKKGARNLESLVMSKCKPAKHAVQLAAIIHAGSRLHVKATTQIGCLRNRMVRRKVAIGLPAALQMEGARKLGWLVIGRCQDAKHAV